MKKENEACQWLETKLTNLDIFGMTIMPTFTTKLGGVTTVVILIFMIWASVISLNSVFEHSEIRFNKNEKKLTLSQKTEVHNILSGNGLKFAFKWVTREGNFVGKTLGEMVILQTSYDNCATVRNCSSRTIVPLEV